MTINETMKPVLILGGNGKTGGRVADRLNAMGRTVRLASRSTEPAFDWLDQSTWPDVLEGAGAVYITYQPDLAVPGAVEAVEAFSRLALSFGVTRQVLLSGRGEEEAQRAEQVLMSSGADWTIVRASWFAQNFSENFLLDGVLDGHLALPPLTVREPFVDADDIADVATVALTGDGHVGQVYEVTGPRLMTFAETLEEIGQAAGRRIELIEVPNDAYEAGLREAGLPDDLVWLVMYLFTTVLDGRNAYVTDGVERALGRAPKDFRDYARDTAATGIWDVPSERAAARAVAG